MNNSKDPWSISTESNEMSLEVHHVPLKGLAKGQYDSAKAFSHAASLTSVTILLLSQQGLAMPLLYGQPLTILIDTLKLDHDSKIHLPGGRAESEGLLFSEWM